MLLHTRTLRPLQSCRASLNSLSTASLAVPPHALQLWSICEFGKLTSNQPRWYLTRASFPKAHVALYDAVLSGDLSKAKQIQTLLSDGDLAQSRLGIGGLKYAVASLYGYGSGRTRRPLQDGTNAGFQAQKDTLQKVYDLEASL